MHRGLALMRGRWTGARFERAVQTLLPELYRTARALGRQAADAEDLVHDACVKAICGFEAARIDSEAACRAWLYRILVNTYRDQYRREMRSPVRCASSPDAEDGNVVELAASTEPGPASRVAYDDFSEAADAAIAALPPEVRIVTALHVLEGLTYRDIAIIVECPIGTVMSRLARGRRSLRRHLSAYAPADSNSSRSKRSERGAAGTRESSC